jgi:polyisoprenoid-binding protein YceI
MSRLLFLVLALISPILYAANLNHLDPAKSQISFTFRQMNVPVDGRFGKFDAQVNVDPAKPESGKVAISVDLASIDSGSAEGNDAVKGREWFNTMAFPKASFVARAIRGLGGGRYEARGPLTIKGVSREMVSVFTLRTDATGAWAEGGFVLPRLQFRIGEGEWADTDTVADAVQIRFKLYLTTKK